METTNIRIRSIIELYNMAMENIKKENELSSDSDKMFDELDDFELSISKDTWIEFTKICLKGDFYE